MNKMYPDWQIGKASINCNYDSFSRFPVKMIYQQLQGKASIRPMWVSDATKKGKTWGTPIGGARKKAGRKSKSGEFSNDKTPDEKLKSHRERLQYDCGNALKRCVNFLMNKFIICTCTPSRNKLFFRIKSLLGGNIRSEQHLIT